MLQFHQTIKTDGTGAPQTPSKEFVSKNTSDRQASLRIKTKGQEMGLQTDDIMLRTKGIYRDRSDIYKVEIDNDRDYFYFRILWEALRCALRYIEGESVVDDGQKRLWNLRRLKRKLQVAMVRYCRKNRSGYISWHEYGELVPGVLLEWSKEFYDTDVGSVCHYGGEIWAVVEVYRTCANFGNEKNGAIYPSPKHRYNGKDIGVIIGVKQRGKK